MPMCPCPCPAPGDLAIQESGPCSPMPGSPVPVEVLLRPGRGEVGAVLALAIPSRRRDVCPAERWPELLLQRELVHLEPTAAAALVPARATMAATGPRKEKKWWKYGVGCTPMQSKELEWVGVV